MYGYIMSSSRYLSFIPYSSKAPEACLAAEAKRRDHLRVARQHELRLRLVRGSLPAFQRSRSISYHLLSYHNHNIHIYNMYIYLLIYLFAYIYYIYNQTAFLSSMTSSSPLHHLPSRPYGTPTRRPPLGGLRGAEGLRLHVPHAHGGRPAASRQHGAVLTHRGRLHGLRRAAAQGGGLRGLALASM